MKFNEFESIRIGLASPDQIREWSDGEVKKPETINYRTLKPEREGLFCEKIFGPQKDWECHCGKYKRIRYKGKICERCGVEITRAKVRRERMGVIELAAPVSHIWYFKTIPSRIGLILDVSPKNLEQVLYFSSYIVTDPGDTPLVKKQLLSEKQYYDMREKYEDDFKAGMGAEAIKKLLEEIDLDKMAAGLKEELETATGQKRLRLFKRLELAESLKNSNNRPEWMIIEALPVIPPDIRPMVQLDGGRFATSDLNDLYRRVINRNNRLKRLLELNAPEIIVRNEKRMLQEAVDALIDNGRRGRPVTGPNNRPLKSLSDMLKGKQGRFRQNLLGKRVDYSGRSVIVVGPELKIYQCGLPKEMALELFKPFVMKRLVETSVAGNIKSARKMVERVKPEVWDALEIVIKDHPVLLNRAPTLHRLGIQAFESVLVEGRALKLHPLVCSAYNADFDGDQMAVHVPLSAEAQAEARVLMLAANNLLKPSDGKPVTVPTQDMILGSYYMTLVRDTEPGSGKTFRNKDEALMAYHEGVVGLHAPIRVRVNGEKNGVPFTRIIDATVGFLILNETIPQNLGFVDRSVEGHELDLEIGMYRMEKGQKVANKIGKKQIDSIIDSCIKVNGTTATSAILDDIKNVGFRYSTQGAITISVSDAIIPKIKAEKIAEADDEIEYIEKDFRRGLISSTERTNLIIATWNNTVDQISEALNDSLDEYNPINMMVDSGARGSKTQIRQLAGMRGLLASTTGETIEVPIRSNYREGLNVLEYFIASRGARKGLADTALRTADSGYLTRRLVDISQDVIIREEDCDTDIGLWVMDIKEGSQIIEPFSDRLEGRYLLEPVINEKTGEIIVNTNKMITEADVKKIIEAGIEKAHIRSILNCKAKQGVCKKCYGANLATGELVTIGEAVGIIAAQSIGEPGTQLTMRTFHTGGIASTEDITQGLPRVEELFEARRPKRSAFISEIDGIVRFEEAKKMREIVVTSTNPEHMDERRYGIPYGYRIIVAEGAEVKKGDSLTEGVVATADILAVNGPEAVQHYIIAEVQKVYRLQAVDINDKHIEVIVRQMMRKVKIEERGDTTLIPGTFVERGEFYTQNEQAALENQEPATGSATLLGITKASLATDSFLSAASFQETTRVLTDASIRGKIDPLYGLKENVIIGKLVPAGTGMKYYQDQTIELPEELPEIDYEYDFEESGEVIYSTEQF